jgi:hypothetical protein
MATLVTDANVLAEVAAIHRIATSAAPSSWTAIITNSNNTAYREIVRVLAAKGYSPAQIATWDEGETFNRNMAVCHALRRIGLPEGQESVSLSKICEAYEELKKLDAFTIAGLVVAPVYQGASISYGSDDTSGDTFTIDTVL